MHEQDYALAHAQTDQLETSKVLRNTYGLLAMTLVFSALCAFFSAQLNLPHPGFLITLVGFYGLFFLTAKLRNSGWGLLTTFALTGFMGYVLGPILNLYLGMANGGELIASALGMTALVFFGLSAYVLTTRKDMSFLGGFITAGCFVLFASACILYQTSDIIHGGERNYVMATISLYVSIYNLFVSLLQIFGIMGSDD